MANRSTLEKAAQIENFELKSGAELKYRVAIRRSYLTGEPIGIRIRRFDKGQAVRALQYDIKPSLNSATYAQAQERLVAAAGLLRERRLLLTGMRLLHKLAAEKLCDRCAIKAV